MNCISILLALSLHMGVDANYNSVHPQVKCEVGNQNYGVYYNSNNDFSFFVSQNLKLPNSEFEFGLVTGYKGSRVLPLMRLKWERKRGYVFLIPIISKNEWITEYPTHTVIHKEEKDIGLLLGYEIKLWRMK